MKYQLLVLPLLCCTLVSALSVTYPVRGTYIGYEGVVSWSDVSPVLESAINAGYNMLILNFYSSTSYEFIQAYDATPVASQQAALNYAHSYGAAILLGVKIQVLYGNLIATDATSLGTQVASWVTTRNLDGVDFSIRETGPGYTLGSRDSATSIAWIVNLTIATRQALGPSAVISFSPQATEFGPIGSSTNGGPGPLGGFSAVHLQIKNIIQHYNVYFFDLGPTCYVDYPSLFVKSASACTTSTSVSEISAAANINPSRIIVTKPIQMYQGSGFVNGSGLHDIFTTAQTNMNWTGGVMGWTWNNTNNYTTDWIQAIYPMANFSPTVSPTTSSSTSTTGSLLPTLGPTVPPITTPTPTPTPTPSPPTPRPNSTSTTTGSAVTTDCASGYIKRGDKCKKISAIIIPIVIPVVVVIAVVIAIVLLFMRRRRRTEAMRKLTRVASQTVSLPDYQSTNLVTEFDEIVIKSRLGQGGSGVVNMGVWRHIEVAVKEFTNQDIATTDFIRESEIHAKLRHPNVVQLLAICLPPHMSTISEYMAKGSLTDVLSQKLPQFTWKRKIHALHDIAKGMDYLHRSKILHRDLKSQNCLIDKNWNCKIADFGTSKLVGEVNATATAYVPRTAQWSAPEVITHGDYSEKSDVYSFGVIMWECFTGEIPYDGMFAFQVEDRTVKGSRLTIPVGCEAWYEALMQACWSAEVQERPNFEGIISALEKAK